MSDNVNHPKHYNKYSIECIEFTRYLPFSLGNALKYVWRYEDKGNPKKDLQKAMWYLNDYYLNPISGISNLHKIKNRELLQLQQEMEVKKFIIINALIKYEIVNANILIEELINDQY